MRRRTFGSAVLAGAALALAPWRACAQGASTFDVQEFDWVDMARQRAVPVRLYLPAAAGDAPVPLVVFSHGIGGSRRGYSYLGQHWPARASPACTCSMWAATARCGWATRSG
jgi:predicted dienelactone hydrolase